MIQNLQKDKKNPNAKPVPLESKMFSRFVKNAQKRIEGQNYDVRKTVLKYDDVIRKQREVMYAQRTDVIPADDIEPFVKKMIENFVKDGIRADDNTIIHTFDGHVFNKGTLKLEDIQGLTENEKYDFIYGLVSKEITNKKEQVPEEIVKEFFKVITLKVMDTHWTRHIDQMDELRQNVRLQSYAQTNPLQVYQEEGYRLYSEMSFSIAKDITTYVSRAQIRVNTEREEVVKNTSTNEGREMKSKPQPKRGNKYQRSMKRW